jgi:hypothetical protein
MSLTPSQAPNKKIQDKGGVSSTFKRVALLSYEQVVKPKANSIIQEYYTETLLLML